MEGEQKDMIWKKNRKPENTIHSWRQKLLTCLTALGFLFAPLSFYGTSAEAAMPGKITDQASYIAWLQATGKPAYSYYHQYAANYEIYRDYRLLTYGTPQMVSGNRYDAKTRQYAIHGFSYDEYTVTNSYFPDDSTVASDPGKWKNIALGRDSQVSWSRLSARQKEHIKQAVFYYSGRDYGQMNYSSLKMREEQSVVIAIPSWNLGFALHTKHYNSRKELRYGTLHGNGIGGIALSGSLKAQGEPLDRTFYIPADKDYLDLTLCAQAWISGYTGLAVEKDIEKGGIILNNVSVESSGPGPWTSAQTIRFARESFSTGDDNRRNVTVKAVIWTVSAMGDLASSELSYTFTLVEKAKRVLTGTLSMKGAISLFQNKKTMRGYSLPSNNLRFLCLEKITLRIDFNGGKIPDYVIFRPVGSDEVRIAVTKISVFSGFAQMVYTMGILPSSLTWENRRINSPYHCSASAYCGTEKTDFMLDGIEITGDVYDLVYLDSPLSSRKK